MSLKGLIEEVVRSSSALIHEAGLWFLPDLLRLKYNSAT